MVSQDTKTFSSIPALFVKRARERGDAPLFFKQYGSNSITYTWNEALARVHAIAAALVRMNLAPGDRVAVMADNGPEHSFCDFAIQAGGGIVVPIYTTTAADQMCHILSDSASKIFFFDKESYLRRIQEAFSNLDEPPILVRMHDPKNPQDEEIPLLSAMMASTPLESEAGEIERRITSIGRDDLSVIIYTSGTTGPAKGVMLSHGNILSNVEATLRVVSLGPSDTFLSFLPMSHSFERSIGHYAMIEAGVFIHYARSLATVTRDFPEAKPTVAAVVPRFLEKMRQRILATLDNLPFPLRPVVKSALNVRLRKAILTRRQKPVPLLLKLASILVGMTGLNKVKEKLGGRIRFLVSGGAALSPELWDFFDALGLVLLQGYGLTETAPVISVNPPERNKPESAGRPLDNLSVRTAEDGEIEVTGPSIMKGYWNLPEMTRAAFTEDGWFKTGDIGRIDEEGYLYITDRKKDIIVSSSGKNISPQNLENALCMDPLVEYACVLGEGQRFLGALLSPNLETITPRIRELGIKEADPASLAGDPRVIDLYQQIVNRVNSNVSSCEKILRFKLVRKPFSMDGGEITPTFKVRRRQVESNHADDIRVLFNPMDEE